MSTAPPPPPTSPAPGLDPIVVWDGNGTEPPPPVDPDNITCNQYTRQNTTFIIYGGYEGVPLNLAANVVLWMVSCSVCEGGWSEKMGRMTDLHDPDWPVACGKGTGCGTVCAGNAAICFI